MNKIPYEERCEVYLKAIWKFGTSLQLLVAVEELSELQKELCKVLRGEGNSEALAEEMADVTIMMEQLRLIFGVDDEVCEAMDAKIERLKEKVSG